MRVFVYYNLHKKLWSIRDCKTRRVIGHSNVVALTDTKPKVSQAGRERVLREKRKNVHAGIEGNLANPHAFELLLYKGKRVTYNPYKYSSFVYKDNETVYSGGSSALLLNREVYV